MKNVKKTAFIALFIGFMVFFTSCSENGGTIIIKNNYPEDKTVTVYSDFSIKNSVISYKDKNEMQNIIAGSTDTFNVKSNINYGIIWRSGNVDAYKTVSVSNGEIIEVTIPW